MGKEKYEVHFVFEIWQVKTNRIFSFLWSAQIDLKSPGNKSYDTGLKCGTTVVTLELENFLNVESLEIY